jgi:serine/threonine-protein kinase
MGGSFGPRVVVGGRYVLQERVGSGASGEVWLARHRTLHSRVAIKVLKPRGDRDDYHEWLQRRFLEEARILAQLQSRHVVRVFDFGTTDEGLAFMAMEFLDGETLAARLRRCGRLSPAAITLLLGQAARGLARAHSAGVVHRDFKPDNVILVTDDDGGGTLAKVIDFGVARSSLASSSRIRIEEVGSDAASSGALVAGTPYYMAPEQTRGEVVDAASDQWAFGVVVYECATGVLPFDGSHRADVFRAIRRGRYVPPSLRASVPRALDEWMRVVLHPDPAQRFGNMNACAEALAVALQVRIASHQAVAPAPGAPLAATGAALLIGILIALQPGAGAVDAGDACAPARAADIPAVAVQHIAEAPLVSPTRPAPSGAVSEPSRCVQARRTAEIPASYRGNPY